MKKIEKTVDKSWADLVKRARTEMPRRLGLNKPWRQEDLAAVLGVSTNYVAMVERGEREPSALFIRALDFAMQLAGERRDPRKQSLW